MKPSTELHDLIRSLTKSEKRFFKLHSALQSGDKNYLRIFEAIDKQPVYDEDALKKLFAKERFIRHFPSEKNHLYKLILKALRSYHAEASVSGILKQEIKNIEILYDKALYDEANKTLHRAKRIARENERFYYWFELLNWEKQLLEEAYESGEFTKDLDALIEEERDVIEKLRNLAAYHILYSKINYVFRSGGYVRTDEEQAMVEEISEHPLIKGKNTALSKRAATICYYTQGFCYWARRDWSTSLEKFSRVRQILDDQPLLRADLPKRYVRTLQYIILCRIELGEFKQAREEVQLMRKLHEQEGFGGIDIGVHVFQASYLCELRSFERTGDFAKAIELSQPIMDGIERFGGRMHKEHQLEFYHGLASVYFGANEVNKSLFWLNKVLNDTEPTLRQDIFIYARLFNLVIHYELGNFDLLEYIVRSTHRFLNKRHRAHQMETLLIESIKKLARATQPQVKRDLFIALHESLKKLLNDPHESTVLNYFDFLSWAEAKVNGTTYAEVIRSRGRKAAQ